MLSERVLTETQSEPRDRVVRDYALVEYRRERHKRVACGPHKRDAVPYKTWLLVAFSDATDEILTLLTYPAEKLLFLVCVVPAAGIIGRAESFESPETGPLTTLSRKCLG